MRESVPMPRRTSPTSAPTRSHRFAISFMNEMRVASMALAAYLVSSAEAASMTRTGLPVRTKGAYSSTMISRARGVVGADDHAVRLQEVLDRGPFLQELRVRDHREGMAASPPRRPRCTRRVVPTGTVDLLTMTL